MPKWGLKTIVCLFTAVFFHSAGYAAETKNVDIAAAVPQQNALSVTISKVTGSVWTAATAVDFGDLVFDTTTNIFKSGTSYYAVDVGVNSNAADWTVTHRVTPVTNGTDTLDGSINVSFMKQTSSTQATLLDKVNYAASNEKAYTKAQLAGGWLRIYYGLASGDGNDAPNTTPVSSSQNAGNYRGSITITLTP